MQDPEDATEMGRARGTGGTIIRAGTRDESTGSGAAGKMGGTEITGGTIILTGTGDHATGTACDTGKMSTSIGSNRRLASGTLVMDFKKPFSYLAETHDRTRSVQNIFERDELWWTRGELDPYLGNANAA